MTKAKRLRYKPTVHAVERIRQYFDVMEDEAKRFINGAMRNAKYVTTQRDGKIVYKTEELDAMVVVDDKTDVIITVLPPSGKGKRNNSEPSFAITKDNEFMESFQTAFKREVAKAKRLYTKEFRRMTEELAIIGLDIAQLTLNKARARSPITQDQITEKIRAMQTERERLSNERKRLDMQYKAMRDGVKGMMKE